MDDKSFDLLEKIYVELQETKKELKAGIQSNSNHIMRLEDEFHNKFGALNDEVKIIKSDVSILKDDVSELKSDVSILKSDVSELKSDVVYIRDRVDIIEEKVENHAIKIQVIEGGDRKSVV